MCTDPSRGRIVLFGGVGGVWPGSVVFGDTWEWDGSNWHLHAPTMSPQPRFAARMSAAPCAPGTCVLFGGGNGGSLMPPDTWIWNGSQWTMVAASPLGPKARGYPGMTYRPSDGRLVMYGDYSTPDTWEWDGATWREVAQGTNPPQQLAGPYLFPNVLDPTRIRCTAKVDYGYGQLLVWELSSSGWSLVQEISSPNIIRAAVAFPPKDQIIALGLTNDQTPRQKMWIQEDMTWRDGLPASALPPYLGTSTYSLVYQAGLRQVMYVSSSYDGNPNTSRQTWLYDGNSWTRVVAGGQAPANSMATAPNIAYDPVRDRVVYLKGREMWEWTQVAGWQRSAVAFPGRAAAGQCMAFDPVRKKLLFYGGYAAGGDVRETLTWDGSQWELINTSRTPIHALGWLRPLPDNDGLMFVSLRVSPYLGYTDIVFKWTGDNWEAMPDRLVPEWPFANPGSQSEWVIADVVRGRYVTLMNDLVVIGEARRLGVDQEYPRPGEVVNLSLSVPSEPRSLYVIALSESGFPGIPLIPLSGGGSRMLPLTADALFVASLQAGMIGQIGGSGTANRPLAIPNLPELAWHDIFAAAVTLDSGFRPKTVTNRVTFRIVK